ncbi:MAG: hypothetical protein PHH06_04570, partial [Candidatus Gracilibacteria bacterium]|nr:hypothetical protein [Candidatus Gracilibacteria bacterium]
KLDKINNLIIIGIILILYIKKVIMKSTFCKSVFTFLFSFVILINQAFSAGGLVEEDCSTGIYSANYGTTCDQCGYFNSGVNRLYYGVPKDFWDFYNNTSDLETVFSSTSQASVIDFGNYLNEESLTSLDRTIRSNWVPVNSPDNEPLVFFIDDLIMNSTPVSRSTPVGRVEYLIRGAHVNSAGNISLNSSEWKYLQGFETQNTNLTWNLTANTYVSDGGGVKNVSNSSIFEHKQCYVILPAWCGDGTIDSAYGETCDDGNNINGDGCSSTCNTEGGGGGGPICYDIIVSGSNITCLGDPTTRSFRLDCGNGDQLIGRSNINSLGYQEYNFNCDYSTNPRVTAPQCFVSQSSTIVDLVNGWFTRLACIDTTGGVGGGGGGGAFCGNGVLESGEDCERTINPDGSLGAFPPFCNSSCQFIGGGLGVPNPFITIPNHGNLVFGPATSTIIGHEVNPYIKINEKPYIYNDSDYDFSFDKLCVKYKEGNSLDYISKTICQNLPDILYPYQKVEFNTFPTFTGNKDLVPDGQSYADNVIVTTIEEDGVLYDNAYFTANFNVRVSKPSIVTSGGGTSYVSDTSKIANINDVAINEQNKNFAGVGVSTGDTSSFSDTTDDADIVSDTQSDGDNYSGSLTTVTDEDGAASSTTTSLSDFENYNGIENVFILRNKNFRITSNYFSSLTGPRTYIVENANLYVDTNLSYPENIAFVVKGGNIIIDASVSSIKGTYISIEKNGVGGSITSGATSTQLTVNGSLYGDVSNLVDNRYYVEETSGALSVGTIVSFGSALFTKPAPLVSQFITEYLNSQKVAK